MRNIGIDLSPGESRVTDPQLSLAPSPPPAQNKVPSRRKCLRGTPPREWNHSTQDRDGRTVAVWCALTNNCEKCKKVALDY